MFGLGIGEILIIFFLIFLISPKDIPKFLRKLGQFFNTVDNIKDDIIDMKNDIKDTVDDDEIKNIDDKEEVMKDIYKLNKNKKRPKK